MPPTELYLKHRPLNFKDVVGCPTTVKVLERMIENKTLPHTILFHGPSGTGKTTLARIVKDALECHPLDFTELNSASYRGIDSIRDIQRNMNLSPQGGPVRVWLMDEVHKLSSDAQNAALKMWEDTPAHVYFLLCTTEPARLLPAVKTRCADMPVKSLNQGELKEVIARVVKKEKIDLPNGTLEAILDTADGSARSALVMLDKVRNLPHKEQIDAVAEGLATEHEAIDLCRALIKKSPWKTVAGILKNLKSEPEETRRMVNGYARSVLLNKGDYQSYIIIDCFKSNFYDSGQAGLALACFEAIQSKD